MRQCLILVLVIFASETASSQSGSLLFQSGFEPTTDTVFPGSMNVDIQGVDNSFTYKNDWMSDLEGAPNNCSFNVQYQGGNDTMRLAEIVADPTDPDNRVLHYWIRHANVPVDPTTSKGRVQGNLYNCETGFTNLFYTVRLFLPHDLDTLKYIPMDITWFTLMEFWNDPNWIDPAKGFRVSVNLEMIDGENGTMPDSLRLGVHGQIYNTVTEKYDSTLWEATNMSFAVPTNKWMTIKINYIEGNATSGRFHMTIQPDGEPEATLFNIENYTHHPGDADPDGLTYHNPFKLYTSETLIDSLRNWNKLTHLYWDDYKVWSDSTLINAVSEGSHQPPIHIYPNPTGGSARIDIGSIPDKPLTLRLYDMLGRMVLSHTGIRSGEVTIDLSGLPTGTYFVEIGSESLILTHSKLIKR